MSDKKLTVLFGTMTGNAEELAILIQEKAKSLGINADLKDLADYPAADLANETEVAIVISTWGEGDPPDEAEEFCYAIFDEKVSGLESLKYTIVALGDTSYDEFCGCGIKMDETLEKLGATRAFERVELDIDFEEGFETWLESYATYLQS